MSHAKNQYMDMIRAKEWHTPPIVNQEILALTVEIKALEKGLILLETWNTTSMHGKAAPKNKEPHVKMINENSFNWCTHHKVWFIHEPSECLLGLPATNLPEIN